MTYLQMYQMEEAREDTAILVDAIQSLVTELKKARTAERPTVNLAFFNVPIPKPKTEKMGEA